MQRHRTKNPIVWRKASDLGLSSNYPSTQLMTPIRHPMGRSKPYPTQFENPCKYINRRTPWVMVIFGVVVGEKRRLKTHFIIWPLHLLPRPEGRHKGVVQPSTEWVGGWFSGGGLGVDSRTGHIQSNIGRKSPYTIYAISSKRLLLFQLSFNKRLLSVCSLIPTKYSNDKSWYSRMLRSCFLNIKPCESNSHRFILTCSLILEATYLSVTRYIETHIWKEQRRD